MMASPPPRALLPYLSLSVCVYCVCVFVCFFFKFPSSDHITSCQAKGKVGNVGGWGRDVDDNLFKDRGKGVVVVFFFL